MTPTETTSDTAARTNRRPASHPKEDPAKLAGEETQAISLEEETAAGHAGASAAGQPAATTPSTPQSPILSGAGEGAAQPLASALAGTRDDPRLPPPSSGKGSSHNSVFGASPGESDGTGCPMGSFDSRLSGSCSGLLGAQRVLASAVSGTIGGVPPSTPPGGGSDNHSPSTVSAPPASPSSSQPPAGAAGGAAAGGSGMALSGFLSLAGLLLLGAPRAMRRLRLSFRLWRASCVALIPERPG